MKEISKHKTYTNSIKPKRPSNLYESSLKIYTKPFRHSILMLKDDGVSYIAARLLFEGESNCYNYCMDKSKCYLGDYELANNQYGYPTSKNEIINTKYFTKI
jgi:hypothetical protein